MHLIQIRNEEIGHGWEGMEEQSEAVQFLSAMGVRFQRGEKVRVVLFLALYWAQS